MNIQILFQQINIIYHTLYELVKDYILLKN